MLEEYQMFITSLVAREKDPHFEEFGRYTYVGGRKEKEP
jgi:hypothetical protein